MVWGKSLCLDSDYCNDKNQREDTCNENTGLEIVIIHL